MSETKIYAGIGSRETPSELEPVIKLIANTLAKKGYTLRSGGADGADALFEIGCDLGKGKKEIYLPWKGFNSNPSTLYGVSPEALDVAKKYHPNWARLNQAAQKLMARNCYQVLGADLKTPVDFIVCWTKDGKASGGTGQALRLAKSYGIQVYNLKNENEKEQLLLLLGLK